MCGNAEYARTIVGGLSQAASTLAAIGQSQYQPHPIQPSQPRPLFNFLHHAINLSKRLRQITAQTDQRFFYHLSLRFFFCAL
jgi:hypothetical protein